MVQNKGLIFKKVPVGWPVEGQDLAIETREFDENQSPPAGGIVTKNFYFSLDPYMRGRMRDPKIKSYAAGFDIDKPIRARGIAKVLKSDNPDFPQDAIVNFSDNVGLEEYSIVTEEQLKKARVLKNEYNLDIKNYLGSLGMPGLTAYSSLYDIGKPQKGETIFISAASGAVGQLVGQLAKHEGLKVIGSVGSDDKLKFIVDDLKFDGGFNYKKEKPADALARLAPNGIDIYFENVGGEQLEAAISATNDFARIIACGMISQYNLKPEELYPIKNLGLVVARRLTMRGFIVSDANMGPNYWKDHQENVSKWLADGSFTSRISETKGIDNGVKALIGMLKGDNFGKAILTIADLN